MIQDMDFGLGETADPIRESAMRFSASEIAPIAAEIDGNNAFPRALWPKMGALGLHGITVEEEYGAASVSAIWGMPVAILANNGVLFSESA